MDTGKIVTRVPQTDHLYYSVWQISIQSATIWNHVSQQDMSEMDVSHTRKSRREGDMHARRHTGKRQEPK